MVKKQEEVKDPNPGVQGQAAEMHEAKNYTPDYGWAVNVVKLNRSKAYVKQIAVASGNELKGKELESAVKARYVEIKGLLSEDKVTGKKHAATRGKVVNLAEHDGTPDEK